MKIKIEIAGNIEDKDLKQFDEHIEKILKFLKGFSYNRDLKRGIEK